MTILRATFMCILAISLMLIGAACNNSTGPKQGKLTGIVHLEGEADHSGVTVSIFQAGLVPAEVSQIQQEHPQLAFPITDKVVFDHRDRQALQTVHTNQDGSFVIDRLPFDEYIIVYRNEGWGYNYLFGVILNQAELNISLNNDLTLYPEQKLPAYLDGPYVLESNKCYIAYHDVTISPNTNLILQDNTRLLLSQNVKISSYGNIEFPSTSGRAYITSYTGMHTGMIDQASLAEGISIIGSSGGLQNVSFSFLSSALKISSSSFALERLSFRHCVFGLTANQVADISINQCLFIKNKDVNGAASYAYNVTGNSITNSIYYDNFIAAKNELVIDGTVENNAFIQNDKGFINNWESIASFEHNYINSSGIGVENSGKSNLELKYNSIMAAIGVRTTHTLNWYNTPTRGWTKASNNNFNCSSYAVKSEARYYNSGQPYPLDFKNNYWGTTNAADIDALIYDTHDISDQYVEFNWAIVEYIPFKSSKVPGAGIAGLD